MKTSEIFLFLKRLLYRKRTKSAVGKNIGVYYGSKAFVVPDDATQVTVDGVNIEFDQYLIELPADNNEHIIIITDQSGNTMEYRIVLYGEYVISYLPGIDGIGSKLEEVRYGDTSEYKIKDEIGRAHV